MDKKITIKDIAREAGVSIATVSYVLNNREDKRISDATKKKVLQVVNMFNYSCSFSARQLSTGKTNIVALYLDNNDFALCLAQKYLFVHVLLHLLSKEGYSLRIVQYGTVERLDNVDAIICYDTPTEFFRAVGDNNFVPLLSYNNCIGDSLFYQINTDYSAARQYASSLFGENFGAASLYIGNSARRQLIMKDFPDIHFVDSFDAAQQLAEEYREKPLLVFEQPLYDYFLPSCKNICIYNKFQQKIRLLVQKMKEVINRQDVINYDIKC